MCKDAKITTEQLTKAMDAEYQKLVQELKDAVNLAPDGAVISGSEELVREAMARFRQKVYEKAVQLRTQAAQAAFSLSYAKIRTCLISTTYVNSLNND